MIYLLDTHVLLWSQLDPQKLSPISRNIIVDTDIQKCISPVAAWEVSLKYRLGKLELSGHTPEELFASALADGYEVVMPDMQDMISLHRLPLVTGHKDPFDRLLIWQAISHDMTLLSYDGKFDDYRQYGLRVAG